MDRYYDEEKFLRQLLREMKQAKKDGHGGQLEIVIRPRKTEAKRENTPAIGDENLENTSSQ